MAGISVIVAGGVVWRMADQGVFSTGQGPAYEPWTNWRGEASEGPLTLVRAAILAANPHNTQPWRFQVSETRIDLFADTTRNIGAIDPDLREMQVGLGCALENLLLAAAANGYQHTLTLMPTPADATHIARVALSKAGMAPSDLHAAIPLRHTDRTAYDVSRSLSGEQLSAITALGQEFPFARIFWFAGNEERTRIGHLMIKATEAVIADRQQAQDSARWMRSSWQEIQTQRDGITIDAQGLSPFIRAAAKALPPFSPEQNDEAWLQNTRNTYVAQSPLFGVLAVRNNRDTVQRLCGGRYWQRLNLWGTIQGLGMQPMNQMSERADREAQLGIPPEFADALKTLIGDPAWQALMPFRIGYPLGKALASPRRAVIDVLK